jgi:hypothetical protein
MTSFLRISAMMFLVLLKGVCAWLMVEELLWSLKVEVQVQGKKQQR